MSQTYRCSKGHDYIAPTASIEADEVNEKCPVCEATPMTREDAMNVAAEALDYALDNDTDYVSADLAARWTDAAKMLAEPAPPTIVVMIVDEGCWRDSATHGPFASVEAAREWIMTQYTNMEPDEWEDADNATLYVAGDTECRIQTLVAA